MFVPGGPRAEDKVWLYNAYIGARFTKKNFGMFQSISHRTNKMTRLPCSCLVVIIVVVFLAFVAP